MSGVHARLRAGGEDYALPIEEVLEVVAFGAMEPMPGAPAGTLGLTAVKGQPLPVFDLAAVLGLQGDGGPGQIVVAEDRGRRIGFAVEQVLDVVELPEARTEGASGRLRGSVLVDGRLVGVLDLAAVVAALEGAVAA
jgi:chemotaxis signal transduction protein